MAFCVTVDLGNGARAIVRMSGKRPAVCAFCKKKYSTKLCDGRVSGGSCDAPMCDDCTTPAGDDKDYCKFHRPKEVQETLFR